MGYSTTFKGRLDFKEEPTVAVLRELKKYLGEDWRDMPDIKEQFEAWCLSSERKTIGGFKQQSYGDFAKEHIWQDGKYGSYWHHIDLELTDDMLGLQWNGSEKTYDLEHFTNWLIDKVAESFPGFGLTGQLLAQGEDMEDRYYVTMIEGRAVKEPIAMTGKKIECPHCGDPFYLEETVNA